MSKDEFQFDEAKSHNAFALWMLPALVLLLPPLVLLLGIVVGWRYDNRLLVAFVLLGLLSPVAGAATLFILFAQRLLRINVIHEIETTNRVRAAWLTTLAVWLALLAIVSPAWLLVMYLLAIGFNR